MGGRKIFNEQDARVCLAAVKASQRGLAEWARAHGIDGRSLNLWRVNFERRGASSRAITPKLIELVAAPVAVTSARYLLHVGGVELELGDDFNEQTLRRLVGLLKSC